MTDQLSLADVRQDRPGLARRDHRDTAKDAAAHVKTGTARWKVLHLLASSWNGLTDEEVSTDLGMSPSTVRPRRVELVNDGWVEASGEQRTSAYGHAMQVWRVTAAGLAALRDAAA